MFVAIVDVMMGLGQLCICFVVDIASPNYLSMLIYVHAPIYPSSPDEQVDIVLPISLPYVLSNYLLI